MTATSDFAADTAAARARLLELIKELAVVRGKVILSSGAEADYYIDLRRITLHHEASKLRRPGHAVPAGRRRHRL